MNRTLRCYWRGIGLAVLLCLFMLTRCASDQVHAADPPMLLLVEQETVVYGPVGERIPIPAGAEIDVCVGEGMLLVYELAPMVVRVPQPCAERALFMDGFEG